MSKVVDTDSGPKVEIKIEETAIPTVSTLSLEGDADVKHEDVTED